MKKNIVTNKDTVKKMIYLALKAEGCSDAGIGGLLGNVEAESAYSSKNLQQSYEKKLGYTDDSYTDAVDSGAYNNFVKDSAGYGLCQWTYWSRKQAMLDYHRKQDASIGDTETQIQWMITELKGYKTVWAKLLTATSVLDAATVVLKQFEKPADQSDAACQKRAKYGEAALAVAMAGQGTNTPSIDYQTRYNSLMTDLKALVAKYN